MTDVRWTAKLPTLLIGLVLIVAGLMSTWRRAAMLGVVLIALGGGFVAYSLTIKDWCELKGASWGQSPWGQGWGGGFGQCLKEKGWLAF